MPGARESTFAWRIQWEKTMLQWNPKLVAILVLLVLLAAAVGDIFPDSFGWGA
jgi:hypothetical protein